MLEKIEVLVKLYNESFNLMLEMARQLYAFKKNVGLRR